VIALISYSVRAPKNELLLAMITLERAKSYQNKFATLQYK